MPGRKRDQATFKALEATIAMTGAGQMLIEARNRKVRTMIRT